MTADNVHATAIVVGTTGLLFVGPSGSGKSAVALDCILGARQYGLFSALISDDQVFLTRAGTAVIGKAPPSIKGFIEIRGATISPVETIDAVVLQHAIMPVKAPFAERISPENELWTNGNGTPLPLVRLPFGDGASPFARLQILIPSILQT